MVNLLLKVSVIPNGLEKCMAFTINRNLFFIDSMQFINSSPDELVKNFLEMNFKYLSKKFSGEQLKGVYPYEYMNSFEKFSENKLPDRCEFYISSKGECISEKHYLHAINVCNTLKRKTMGEYHDLYLKTDVLLLADIFEKFIDMCLK